MSEFLARWILVHICYRIALRKYYSEDSNALDTPNKTFKDIFDEFRYSDAKSGKKRKFLKDLYEKFLHRDLRPDDILISLGTSILIATVPEILGCIGAYKEINGLPNNIFDEKIKKIMRNNPNLYIRAVEDESVRSQFDKLRYHDLTSEQKQFLCDQLSSNLRINIKLDLASNNFNRLNSHLLALLTLSYFSNLISFSQYVKAVIMVLATGSIPSTIKEVLYSLAEYHNIDIKPVLDLLKDNDSFE